MENDFFQIRGKSEKFCGWSGIVSYGNVRKFEKNNGYGSLYLYLFCSRGKMYFSES